MIIYSEKHVLLMWSVAFYIAENFVHELKEMEFVNRLFQVSFCVSYVLFDTYVEQNKKFALRTTCIILPIYCNSVIVVN